ALGPKLTAPQGTGVASSTHRLIRRWRRSEQAMYRFDISAILSGVLELAILGLLKEHDLHGYELKKRLTETLGTFSSVSFGSLYPALGRLERAGAVSAVTAEPDTVAVPVPMTGSLDGELAAYRAT